jgi:hypothetical protein
LEVKTQVFDVPTSAGALDWNISGWTETPKAAKIIIVATDGTDSFDNDSEICIGFTDGTNEVAFNAYSIDGGGTSVGERLATSSACALIGIETGDITGAFSQWNAGVMELTWAGASIANTRHKAIVTFFAGDDVDAAVIVASAGDHVESLSFTSKLIFSVTHGNTIPGGSAVHILTHGVCTNGSNGLEQNFISNFWSPGVGTSSGSCFLETAHVSGQAAPDIDWETAISSIDSVGFNLDGSDTDDIGFLCIGFSDDVDSGYATIPTSGSINNTTPGFEPQIVGVLLANTTSVDTKQNTGDILMGVGEYDGTRENSISVVGEDEVTTMNHTSVHSSEVVHTEDPDQNDIIDSSSISFDSSGFDITFTTHPGTATYYIWWAIEAGAAGPQSGTVAESASISEAQTAVQERSDSNSESASADDAPATQAEFNSVGSESASADDTPSSIKVHAASIDESASADDAPTVQAVLNDSGSESASISESQTGEEINEGAVAESASVDDAPTVQAILNDSGSESASADDAPAASQQFDDSVSESASVDETSDAAAAQNVATDESLSADEAQTAIKVQADSMSESASVDEAPATQADFNSIGAESASISEAQTATEDNEGEVLESASVDETPSVQAVLNDSVSESASISEIQTGEEINEASIAESASVNEVQTAQQEFNRVGSESASVNETSDGELEAQTGNGVESLSVSETQDAQLITYSDATEDLAITAVENGSWVSGSSIAESASIGEAQTSILESDLIYEIIRAESLMSTVLALESPMSPTLSLDSKMSTVFSRNSIFIDG